MDSPEIPMPDFRLNGLKAQLAAFDRAKAVGWVADVYECVAEIERLRASIRAAESQACPHCLDLALKICDYQTEISKQFKRIAELSASLQEKELRIQEWKDGCERLQRERELETSVYNDACMERDMIASHAKDLEAELARYRGTEVKP